MSTRIISWQQLVLENDPNWIRNSLNPLVWEFSNGRWFVDPAAPYTPLPDSGLINDGSVLVVSDTSSWPASSKGLGANRVWNNGGVVTLASGSAPVPGAAHMFFGQITASQMLLFGGGGLPLASPSVGSNQLWNNGGIVCIA